MKIVYIVGCTHNGSTLLGRILNQHERVFAAGELQYLDVYWGPTGRRCSCGVHAMRCPVWAEVFWRMVKRDRLRPTFARLSTERPVEWRRALFDRHEVHQRFVRANVELFRAIVEVTGRDVIVDSSKSIWRLLPLWRGLPDTVYALHLVRSPEGQVASRMGRTVRSFWRAALGEYLRVNWNARWLFGGDPRYRRVRYEDLVERPEDTIRALHEWLGLDWRDPFARPSEPAHDIGGNPATKKPARGLRPDPAHAGPTRDFRVAERMILGLLRRVCYGGPKTSEVANGPK